MQLNNPDSDAGSSGLYITGSAGDAGRDRRLEANEQTRSRYELAGLRVPTIAVQASAASQQYATDIASAVDQVLLPNASLHCATNVLAVDSTKKSKQQFTGRLPGQILFIDL